jgi:hypothetical protein
MKIVIEAAVDRLVVTGFRFGEERDDQDAWKELWQPNNLDLESRVLHRTAGVCGVAFTLTDPINPYGDYPRITVEHPNEAAVICAPGTRHVRIAGIKKWWDENDGYTYANVFTPDTVFKWKSQKATKREPTGRVDWGTVAIEHNSLGRVPLVPFFNKPGANYGGESDLVDAIPIQDAINHIVRNVVLGVEFQGFPQRAILGWEPPLDPETKKPIPGTDVKMSQSRVLAFKDKDVKLAEVAAANLANFKSPMDMFIAHLSAQTRTPATYLLSGDIANVGQDTLKTSQEGLVFRCKDKHVSFSDPWEDTMRNGFIAIGDTEKAAISDAETLWADPENKSEAEKIDAATKLWSMGVPLEVALLRAGYSQKEVEQMKSYEGFGVPPKQNVSPPAEGAPSQVGAGGA